MLIPTSQHQRVEVALLLGLQINRINATIND